MSDLLDHRIKASGFRHSEHYIDCTCGASLTVPSMAGGSEVKAAAMLDEFWLSHKSPLIKSAPETAELERNVIAEARKLVASFSPMNPASGICDGLVSSVEALEKALAPPSLEDDIRSTIDKYQDTGQITGARAANLTDDILDIVKAHNTTNKTQETT